MAISFKAIQLRDTLAADLALRTPSFTITKSFDSGDTDYVGAPVITWSADSSPGVGEQMAVIRVKQLDAVGTDILGLTQNVFTPTVIQIGLEASSVSGACELDVSNWLLLIGECLKFGTLVEVYMSDDGTAPSTDNDSCMVASKLQASFWPAIQYPLGTV